MLRELLNINDLPGYTFVCFSVEAARQDVKATTKPKGRCAFGAKSPKWRCRIPRRSKAIIIEALNFDGRRRKR